MEASGWQRVGRFVSSRMFDLNLGIDDVPGASRETVRHIRKGDEGNYSERKIHALTRALRWTPDSIQRILDGGEPIELEPGAVTRRRDDEDRLDQIDQELAELRAEVKRLAGLVANMGGAPSPPPSQPAVRRRVRATRPDRSGA